MPYTSYFFKFNKVEHFQCVICLSLLKDPLVCCSHGHLICLDCLIQLRMANKDAGCAVCRAPIVLSMPPPCLREILTELWWKIEDRAARKRVSSAKLRQKKKKVRIEGKENLTAVAVLKKDDTALDRIAVAAAKLIHKDRVLAMAFKEGVQGFSTKDALDEFVCLLKASASTDLRRLGMVSARASTPHTRSPDRSPSRSLLPLSLPSSDRAPPALVPRAAPPRRRRRTRSTPQRRGSRPSTSSPASPTGRAGSPSSRPSSSARRTRRSSPMPTGSGPTSSTSARRASRLPRPRCQGRRPARRAGPASRRPRPPPP